jgi:hypothetical protein
VLAQCAAFKVGLGLLYGLLLCISPISVRAGWFKPIPRIGPASNNISPAVCASMGVGTDIAENIIIIYVTVNKQSGLTFDDPQSICIRNLSRFAPAFSVEFAIWRDRVPSAKRYRSTVLWRNRKLLYHSESSDFRNYPCWTFAVVLNTERDTREDRRRPKISFGPVSLTRGGSYLEAIHLNVLDKDMRPFDIEKRPFAISTCSMEARHNL